MEIWVPIIKIIIFHRIYNMEEKLSTQRERFFYGYVPTVRAAQIPNIEIFITKF